MPRPLLIFSQSDYLIQVVDTNSNTEWQTVQIQISWLLQKPTDLDLHCLQRQDISGFSRTRIKALSVAMAWHILIQLPIIAGQPVSIRYLFLYLAFHHMQSYNHITNSMKYYMTRLNAHPNSCRSNHIHINNDFTNHAQYMDPYSICRQ